MKLANKLMYRYVDTIQELAKYDGSKAKFKTENFGKMAKSIDIKKTSPMVRHRGLKTKAEKAGLASYRQNALAKIM